MYKWLLLKTRFTHYSDIILPNNIIYLLSTKKSVNIYEAPTNFTGSDLSLLYNLLIMRVSWRLLDCSSQGKLERKPTPSFLL